MVRVFVEVCVGVGVCLYVHVCCTQVPQCKEAWMSYGCRCVGRGLVSQGRGLIEVLGSGVVYRVSDAEALEA